MEDFNMKAKFYICEHCGNPVSYTHLVPEYDPVLLVEKTQGRMAEDHKWLEII